MPINLRRRRTFGRLLLGLAGVGGLAIILLATIGTSTASPDCRPCEVSTDQWSQLPPEKQKLLQREEQQYQEALSQGGPSPNVANPKSAATAPTSAPQPWPEGVFDIQQAPLSQDYVIENQWQANLDGHVQVYAGSLNSDPSQGLVVVLVTSADLTPGMPEAYRTATKSGPLRIIASNGQRLSLVSRTGALFAFDVPARRFVSAEPVPVWPSGTSEFGKLSFPAGQPFPGNMFDIQNVWQGDVHGAYERVFAGSYLADPSQGVVIVQVVPSSLWVEPGSNDLSQAVRLTQAKAGPVHIMGATAGVLTLETANGSTLAFDTGSSQLASR
jgi:hypothetical protein